MSSVHSTGAQPTSELESAGVIRHNSLDVSIAGSMASDSDLTVSPTLSFFPSSSMEMSK
jgi:hypothetical protein